MSDTKSQALSGSAASAESMSGSAATHCFLDLPPLAAASLRACSSWLMLRPGAAAGFLASAAGAAAWLTTGTLLSRGRRPLRGLAAPQLPPLAACAVGRRWFE